MEDLLYLYTESFHPFVPMFCFDERAIQLLAVTKEPLAVEPGNQPDLIMNTCDEERIVCSSF